MLPEVGFKSGECLSIGRSTYFPQSGAREVDAGGQAGLPVVVLKTLLLFSSLMKKMLMVSSHLF